MYMVTVLFSETVTAMCVHVSALSTPAAVYSMPTFVTYALSQVVAEGNESYEQAPQPHQCLVT
jgi:hypothetical protein